ncbi:MAG TPA: sulfotransferase [Terriglobales bacterium]|nr:sulfotransferase [Terriglobales bacterium]
MPNSGSGPLIVVGLWRSGTSLLYSLLNQHSEIALLYEGDLFLLRSRFRPGNEGDWRGRWEFWNSALSRHNIDTAEVPAAVPDFATAATSVWKQYAGDAVVWGEKSPDYYDCMETLAREFPGARFLVIWRDLADTCRSIVRARAGSTFFSKPGLLHRAIIGHHKLKQQCDLLLAQAIPVHQIHYEELIQDPEQVMAGVCDFLGLAFEPRMASLRGADRSAIYKGSHHEQVKSEGIVSDRRKDEVLPENVKSKIERYVNYWHRRYAGTWPRYPKMLKESTAFPSLLERCGDEILFRILRMVDGVTQAVYCYAPYRALERYRSAKARRHAQTATESVPEQSPAENVPS